MSKALSASVTFEALEDRVTVLEGGPTFTGTVSVGDSAYNLMINGVTGNPVINFASGDYLAYDRGTDSYTFNIGSAVAATINSTGLTIVSSVMLGDGNFVLDYNSGSAPRVTFDSGDLLAYSRSSNNFQFIIGNTAKAILDSNGLGVAGNILPGNDNNFILAMASGKPRITLDSGDYIEYDRTANKYNFYVGSAKVASLDASGNMRLLGTLTQSVAP